MKITERIRSWNKTRRTVQELSALSDRDLADIGISRHDIRWVAGQTR